MCLGLLAATGVRQEGCVEASRWELGGVGWGPAALSPPWVWLLGWELGQSGMLCWCN